MEKKGKTLKERQRKNKEYSTCLLQSKTTARDEEDHIDNC